MKKWEYKFIVCRSLKKMEAQLNHLGVEGWRVVQLRMSGSSTGIVILEREIPEPPAESKPETIVELRVLGEDGKMRIEPPDDLSTPVKIVSPGYADPSLHHTND